MKKLTHRFFARDTHRVARELLGKILIRRWRAATIQVRITEVEAYIGENDDACHARIGKTKRNAVMYGAAGHAYIYLVYGMYNCLNIVTERKGFPAAILIRSGKFVTVKHGGRATTGSRDETLRGPGRLSRTLHITRAQNGENLAMSSKMFLADDGFIIAPRDIKTAQRIGVDYAGKDALLLWRYFI